ncbi:MAG: hypothetical protein M0Z55_00720 [Peptococcaceae bacterium]|nr:hypothetical protein [Peptococcaceae bacterium]
MKKDLRCSCKKLVCQIDGDDIVLKCRHCKKIIYIHTRGLISMEYRVEEPLIKLNSIPNAYQSR